MQRIFEPIKLNTVEIRNRIFRAAHGTHFIPGKISDQLIAYHAERAKSGVGLSFLEIASVHPSSMCMGIHAWDDSIIADYERMMKTIRPLGMKVFQQIWHGGSVYPTTYGGASWSASDVATPFSTRRPRPMTKGEIEEIIAAYGETARRCVEGGLDGCEVQFGHGYLIHQFLSPLTNHRTDEYGGSLENRMRLGRSILRLVRATVGPDFPVGIRISDELTPGGINAEECAEVVRQLESEGLIDFVNGAQSTYFALENILPAMDKPMGSLLPSAATMVAAASNLPRLITPGRVRTLEEADQIIRDGTADMVSMVRAMIADPDLVRKTREGRAEQVRPCISCNQGCVAAAAAGYPVGCTVNPVIGMEATHSETLITPAAKPQRVVVVGGGPAGMEAARIAATAGHRVTLMEASPNLGGLVNVATRAPNLYTLGDYTTWQQAEIYRLGVDVRLNTYVEADDVLAETPDAVIVATGGLPRLDGIQTARPGAVARGVDKPHVVSSVDLLSGAVTPGKSALVLDDLGHYEAVAAAEFLVANGVDVTFATRFSSFAPSMEMTMRNDPALRRLLKGPGKFQLMTRMLLLDVRDGECDLQSLVGEAIETVPADTVVLVMTRDALRDLYNDLEGKVAYRAIAGDAESPGDLQLAIREGHMAARAIVAG